MSRKAWSPTKKDIENLSLWAGRGMTAAQMADMLGIDRATLFRYKALKEGNNAINDSIKQGRAKATVTMTGKLWKIANNDKARGQVAALIFWLKNIPGWSDRQTLLGDEDQPITDEHKGIALKPGRARTVLDLVLGAHVKKSSWGKKKSKKKPKKKQKKKPKKKPKKR